MRLGSFASSIVALVVGVIVLAAIAVKSRGSMNRRNWRPWNLDDEGDASSSEGGEPDDDDGG